MNRKKADECMDILVPLYIMASLATGVSIGPYILSYLLPYYHNQVTHCPASFVFEICILIPTSVFCIVYGLKPGKLGFYVTGWFIIFWMTLSFALPVIYNNGWRTRTYEYPCYFKLGDHYY